MPRPLFIALVASLCFAFTARAEDKPSPAVKRILDKAVVKVRANRTEFDKANKKPLDEARKELQDLSTDLIRNGKTDEAKAVLGQVGTLEADVMKMANAPAPALGAGRPGPEKPLLERLAGKWDRMGTDFYVVIEADGSIQQGLKSTGKLQGEGKAQIVAKDADKCDLKWPSGWRWTLRSAGEDAIAVFEWLPSGERNQDGFVLERIK